MADWIDVCLPLRIRDGDGAPARALLRPRMIALTRREWLALALAALWPVGLARAAVDQRTAPYAADVGILYGALSFHVTGTIDEAVDRAAGRYRVKVHGTGDGIETTVDGAGVRREGRWAPTHSEALFLVYGRQTRTTVDYDYDRNELAYRSRGETFFLRRVRAADDRLALPTGKHIDDVISATLNYADSTWPPDADGVFRTHVVRRQRITGEGPDDVQKSYRAELVPLVLRVESDRESGRPTALFDMTRFSSWAREDQPGRIVFGPDRRPSAITSSLMLGTSVSIRIGS